MVALAFWGDTLNDTLGRFNDTLELRVFWRVFNTSFAY